MKRISSAITTTLFSALPLVSLAQVNIIPQPTTGESLNISAANYQRWVDDLSGGCGTGNVCIGAVAANAQIGPSVQFALYSSPTVAQADASVGIHHIGSTPNSWDLTPYSKITFYYRDQNARSVVNGNSSLRHYFLIYDSRNCYREWVINMVNNDGTPVAGSPLIKPNVWYQLTGSFTDPQGPYIIQGGTSNENVPDKQAACVNNPLKYSEITYFETGVFAGTMRPKDGILYNWLVGPVTPIP